MPELPEAEITTRVLRPLLIKRRLLGFWTDLPKGVAIFKPSAISRDIKNRQIQAVERRGKAIVLWLSSGRVLAFHQKLSGKLLIVSKGTARKHIHYRFLLSASQARRARASSRSQELAMHDVRKFSKIWYGRPVDVLKSQFFAKLGRDPLLLSAAEFRKILSSRKGMIKPLLLRQDILAGIGNIIADESLWKAKIHPSTRIERLGERDLGRLFRAIKFVLQKSIQLGGSSMQDWLRPDGAPGGYY